MQPAKRERFPLDRYVGNDEGLLNWQSSPNIMWLGEQLKGRKPNAA